MKKDTSVNVRLTRELRSDLQSLADADGRKLSNYIERVLQAHVERTLRKGKPERPQPRR